MLSKFENPIYWIGILSALKLFTQTIGFSIISDAQINDIANGIAAGVTFLAGVVALWSSKNKNAVIAQLKANLK